MPSRSRAGRYGGSFRVVNSESDFLPGLVIDKYEGQVVVQLLTYGMERLKRSIVDALKKSLSPSAIVLRNDSLSRKEEGLSQYVEVAQGPVVSPTIITVGPLRFLTDILAGHKTGFYFDQSENRLLMREFSGPHDPRCLLIHRGIRALCPVLRCPVSDLRRCVGPGPRHVQGEPETQQPQRRYLRQVRRVRFLKNSTEAYDVIVLDPPSFIKSRKRTKEGEKGYIDLHKKALRRVEDGGFLFHLLLLLPYEALAVQGRRTHRVLRRGRCLPRPGTGSGGRSSDTAHHSRD